MQINFSLFLVQAVLIVGFMTLVCRAAYAIGAQRNRLRSVILRFGALGISVAGFYIIFAHSETWQPFAQGMPVIMMALVLLPFAFLLYDMQGAADADAKDDREQKISAWQKQLQVDQNNPILTGWDLIKLSEIQIDHGNDAEAISNLNRAEGVFATLKLAQHPMAAEIAEVRSKLAKRGRRSSTKR